MSRLVLTRLTPTQDDLDSVSRLTIEELRREVLYLAGLATPEGCFSMVPEAILEPGLIAFCRKLEEGAWAVVRRESGACGPGWSGYLQIQTESPHDFSYAQRYGGCFAEEVIADIVEDWPEVRHLYMTG